jgi:hypothetical protein
MEEEDLARSQDQLAYEELVTNILEEEDDVVACHRQQIEDNMALVQEEMGLLTQVEMPGGSVEVCPLSLSYGSFCQGEISSAPSGVVSHHAHKQAGTCSLTYRLLADPVHTHVPM